MIKTFYLLFSFLVLISFSTLGQNNSTIEFKHIYASDMGVEYISQQSWDEDGNLWAITDKGLLKYDGYSTEFLKNTPGDTNSIRPHKIWQLMKVAPDEYWITYQGNTTLSKFNPRTREFKHIYLDSLNENGNPRALIVKILKDNNGQIWLGTWGDGLLKLDQEKEKCKTYKFPKTIDNQEQQSFVKEITILKNGKLLICFFNEVGGIYSWPVIFNPKTKDYVRMDVEHYIPFSVDEGVRVRIEISMRIVHFAYQDKNDDLWFGTYSGLIHFDSKDSVLTRVTAKGEDLRRVNLENTRDFVIHERELWIGTSNRGIMIVDLLTKEVRFLNRIANIESSLIDSRVHAIKIDPLDNIWVSTESGNLSIFSPITKNFQIHEWDIMDLEYSNRSEQTTPLNQMLVRPSGKILLSHLDGLKTYDPETRSVINEVIPGSHTDLDKRWVRINSFSDNSEKIKMTFNFGPAIYYKNEDKLKTFDFLHRGYHVLFQYDTLQNRDLFFQGNKYTTSIYEHINNADTLVRIVLLDDGVGFSRKFSHILDSGNWLISASFGRFIIYHPTEGNYDLYSPSQSENFFPDSTIRNAYINSDETIYFGTSKGLYDFNIKSKKATLLNDKIGLETESSINAIIKDNNNNLWIALQKDLICWNEIENTLVRYDKKIGLDVGEFLQEKAQIDKAGKLYFATQNGILIFDPNKVKLPNNKLQLQISSIYINDSLQSNLIKTEFKAGNMNLNWEDNFVTFEFSTNQIYSLTPHQFRYRLIGQNDKWIDNGTSNSIRFADLSYGKYNLEVIVKNTYGIESETYKIPFKIKRPYWLSIWFYIIIGIVLIFMVIIYIKKREEILKRQKEVLENIVTERTKEAIQEKNIANKLRKEAEGQKEILEQKQQEITDSISYAKRIQDAILPSNEAFNSHIPNSFVLYIPKDIVAGDFYWMHPFIGENKVLFASADCTGHGVPGAMVSVVCNNALNRSVREFKISDPGNLLDKTREIVIEQFEKGHHKVEQTKATIKDGMDISLCLLDKNNNTLKWAGANNPLWIARNQELIELKGDRQPVGKHDPLTPFTTHEIELFPNDIIYVFSDGYADQFGGEKGKKFKTSSLRKLILKISTLPMNEQLAYLQNTFDDWKGEYEHLDDVCFIGVKI